MKTETLFSSKSDEWATPQEIYDALDEEFSFDLDPCATAENHKCKSYYSLENNGLEKNWGGGECSAIPRIARFLHGYRSAMKSPKRQGRYVYC